jgi:hypothetical protein
MVGELLVHAEGATAITGGNKQSHEASRPRLIAGVEPDSSTDRVHFGLTRALELTRSLPRRGRERPA